MRSAPCAWASPSAAMDRLSTPGSACAQAGVGPKCSSVKSGPSARSSQADRKSTRLNSSHSQISYAVFCLKKKKNKNYKNKEKNKLMNDIKTEKSNQTNDNSV